MWNPVKPFRLASLALATAFSAVACGSDANTPDTASAPTTTSKSQETVPSQPATITPKSATSQASSPAQAGRTAPPTSTASSAAGSSASTPKAGAAATAQAGSAGAAAAAGSGGSTQLADDVSDAGVTNASMGGTQPRSGRAPLNSLKYPTTKEKVADAPTFNITRPMDLNVTEGKLPVIVWANGGCFRSDFTWTPLFERWASAGFVVLALTGSGSDDDITSMLDTTTKTEHKALVDWVEKANASGPYAGKLDLDRIVASGNSCGGVTALETTAEDKRVDAVFVLSGSSAVGSVNKDVMSAIDVPVGYVTGNPSEDVAAPNAADDYEAMKDGLPGMLVQRKMGDHITVSTDEKVLPEDAEIALNWLDLALYGTKQAYDTLTSPKVCDNCTPDTWNFKAKHLETLIK